MGHSVIGWILIRFVGRITTMDLINKLGLGWVMGHSAIGWILIRLASLITIMDRTQAYPIY